MKKIFLVVSLLFCWEEAFSVIRLSVTDKNAFFDLAKKILPNNPKILDAGAFDGTDSVTMAKMWPNGTVYSFEPVSEIYDWLIAKTRGCNNIYCFNIALSDKQGYQKFFLSEAPYNPGVNFQSGSLLAPKEHLKYSDIQFKKDTIVSTITIDQWAKDNNILHLDMLWLDLQGMELNVLKASPNILSTVRVICAEVEFVEAYEGQGMYEDVKSFMLANGFVEYARNFDAPGKGGWGWFGDVMFVRGCD